MNDISNQDTGKDRLSTNSIKEKYNSTILHKTDVGPVVEG